MKTKDIARAVILVAVAVALSPVFYPRRHHQVFSGAAYDQRDRSGHARPLVRGGYRHSGGDHPKQPRARDPAGLSGRDDRGPSGGAGLPGVQKRVRGRVGRSHRHRYPWVVGQCLDRRAAPYGKSMPLGVLMLAFSASTVGGTIIGLIALHLLKKGGIWEP